MEGIELPCTNAAEVARVVRALGSHRYVAGRLLSVHAAAFDAVRDVVSGDAQALLEDALRWSEAVLGDRAIDPASRDERLHRRSTEKEVAAVLEALWGESRERAHARLSAWLERCELTPPADAAPFDETLEEDIHPLLIDAGWELLSLAELDPERHRGAIEAYPERIDFESARFEESEAIPRRATLHELSAIGPVEALRAIGPDGALVQPLVLYVEGDAVYVDYVLRGVLRAAKLA